MASVSRNWVLGGIVLAVLIAVTPRAILRIVHTGDLYLFTDQFFHDILARLSGPGRLRFIIQPTVAIILGARGGMKDASAGLPPFLWALRFSSRTPAGIVAQHNHIRPKSGRFSNSFRSDFAVSHF